MKLSRKESNSGQETTERKRRGKQEKKKEKDRSERTKGLVVLPYVRGMSERIARTLNKHNIQSAMKPATTLRSLLVHPKDKIHRMDNVGVVYEIPCNNCEKKCIGETGRRLSTCTRNKEHKIDAEKNRKGPSTCPMNKTSLTERIYIHRPHEHSHP